MSEFGIGIAWLAVELGGDGIRVSAILPGNVDTPMMREWAATLDDPQSALDRIAKLQVFGRMATSEETAASPSSSPPKTPVSSPDRRSKPKAE